MSCFLIRSICAIFHVYNFVTCFSPLCRCMTDIDTIDKLFQKACYLQDDEQELVLGQKTAEVCACLSSRIAWFTFRSINLCAESSQSLANVAFRAMAVES